MISENSFISSVSHSSAHFNSFHLKQIESSVFAKIINLKSQKIQLMSHLSQTIDKKYEAEDELLKVMKERKENEEKLVGRREYQPMVRRYYDLKDEANEYERQIKERSIILTLSEQHMIQQIMEQKRQNQRLEIELAKQVPVQQKIKQLKNKIKLLTQVLTKKQAESEKSNKNSQIPNEKTSLAHLRSIIEQQEQNKKLLYDELIQFTQQMQQLRNQNETLRKRLGMYDNQN